MTEAKVVRLVEPLRLVYAAADDTEKLYCFSLDQVPESAGKHITSSGIHIGTKVRFVTDASGKVLQVYRVDPPHAPQARRHAAASKR